MNKTMVVKQDGLMWLARKGDDGIFYSMEDSFHALPGAVIIREATREEAIRADEIAEENYMLRCQGEAAEDAARKVCEENPAITSD